MKRKHSLLAEPGAANFITTTVIRHLPIFSIQPLAEILINNIKFYSSEYRIQIHGYVIMPSHIHLLASETYGRSIPQFCGSLKGFSAKQILYWCRENKKAPYLHAFAAAGRNNRHEHQFQVWEEGYDNAVITRNRDLLIKLEYMHANPLQDKWALCKNPEDYFYSSAAYYLEDKETAIPIVRIV
jgi:putative transposase